jgi:capsular polysaccharide biosynthesis protein
VTWNDVNLLALRILTRWWIVVMIMVAVVGVSAWRVSDSPATYQATALMVVSPRTDLERADALRVAELLNRDVMMSTYVDVLASPLVVGPAMMTGSDASSRGLQRSGYEIRVTREPGSSVIRMIAEGPDKFATETLVERARLAGESTLTELYPMLSITPLSNGSPEARLISMSAMRVIAIGVVVGLGFGLLVALWFDSLLDYRARSAASAVAASPRRPVTVEMGPAGQQLVNPRRP